MNPKSWGAQDLARYAAAQAGATVLVRRGPHDDIPKDWNRIDRVVISGSLTRVNEDAPWIESLLEQIRRWVDRGTPLLGVCYGHQMLNRALGGKECVRASSTPEFGWTEIQPT